jgi:hypothetical protein
MGREIRRVPPNWEHPTSDCRHSPWKGGCGEAILRGDGRCSHPLYDRDVETAFTEWLAEFEDWKSRGMAEANSKYGEKYSADEPYRGFCEWNGSPPSVEYYRPRWTEEPSWYQLYETVSEGTPVSPPFETQEELAQYLAENGDYWYQRDIQEGKFDTFRSKPTIEQARSLVGTGWAPSLIMVHNANGQNTMLDAYQQQEIKNP